MPAIPRNFDSSQLSSSERAMPEKIIVPIKGNEIINPIAPRIMSSIR
jgi:hypothetical protein